MQYEIGIPLMVRTWSWVGFALGIGLIPFLWWLSQNPESFQFISALVAGTVGILIGFRIVLFHDIELMTRWNVAYIALIATNIILVSMLGLNHFPH